MRKCALCNKGMYTSWCGFWINKKFTDIHQSCMSLALEKQIMLNAKTRRKIKERDNSPGEERNDREK